MRRGPVSDPRPQPHGANSRCSCAADGEPALGGLQAFGHRGARGRGFQGFLPGQDSTASVAKQIVDIPVVAFTILFLFLVLNPKFRLKSWVKGFSASFPVRKSAEVARQVGARVHAHSSSSTLSAHQMARGWGSAKIRRHPPPQAAGTVYCPLDVDEVPAAGGLPARPSARRVWTPGAGSAAHRELDSRRRFSDARCSCLVEVSKISSPSRVSRTALSEPQTAEQLLEVPTIVSYSSLQQQTTEQNVDIPVPRRGDCGSPHCFSPTNRFFTAFLWSRTLSFQFLAHVLVEAVEVSPDRAPHSVMWSRTFTFQFLARVLVEVFKVFHPDGAHRRRLALHADSR